MSSKLHEIWQSANGSKKGNVIFKLRQNSKARAFRSANETGQKLYWISDPVMSVTAAFVSTSELLGKEQQTFLSTQCFHHQGSSLLTASRQSSLHTDYIHHLPNVPVLEKAIHTVQLEEWTFCLCWEEAKSAVFPQNWSTFMLLLRVEAKTLPSWNVISTEVEPPGRRFWPPSGTRFWSDFNSPRNAIRLVLAVTGLGWLPIGLVLWLRSGNSDKEYECVSIFFFFFY